MKRLFLFLLLLIGLPVLAADRITVSVTVTNATTNGMTFVLNAATRTFTNSVVVPATQVLTNSTATGTKTNLLDQIRSYPFISVQSLDAGATNLNLTGNAGVAMSATIAGNWGFVTYSTQTVSQMTAVRVPVSGEISPAVQTNVSSGIVAAINSSPNTNELQQTSKAATQLVGTTNAQTVTGAKDFNAATGVWRGIITNSPAINGFVTVLSNGLWRAGFLSNPTLTNGVNYGNAFRSPGTGTASEQFGTSASASGNSSVAVGNTAVATNTGAVALGFAAVAGGDPSLSLGSEAIATGSESQAVGYLSVASADDASAFGPSSTAAHTGSTALGWTASTTAAGQVRIGIASDHVSIPGGLHVVGVVTNLNAAGTNQIDGHLKFIRKAVTTLANGANAAIPISTNTFVEVSGPSAAFTNAGFANGTDGRFLILLNQTGQHMTFAHESGLESVAANRVVSMTGGDRATVGNGAAFLIYSAAASRWILLHVDP